jgi:hypothetical protein
VLSATAAYHEATQRFEQMGTLDTWYAHVTIDEVLSVLEDGKARRKAFTWIGKARSSFLLLARLAHPWRVQGDVTGNAKACDRVTLFVSQVA